MAPVTGTGTNIEVSCVCIKWHEFDRIERAMIISSICHINSLKHWIIFENDSYVVYCFELCSFGALIFPFSISISCPVCVLGLFDTATTNTPFYFKYAWIFTCVAIATTTVLLLLLKPCAFHFLATNDAATMRFVSVLSKAPNPSFSLRNNFVKWNTCECDVT